MRRVGRCASLAVVVLLAAGCAPGPTDLSAGAAERLQTAVLELTEASAEGRYDAAASAAEGVRAALDRAVEEGEVSVARYRDIDRALRHVHSELDLLRGPVQAWPPVGPDTGQAPLVATGPGVGGAPDASPAEVAAVEAAGLTTQEADDVSTVPTDPGGVPTPSRAQPAKEAKEATRATKAQAKGTAAEAAKGPRADR